MEVHDWTSHLEHHQSIEFDVDRAPEKPDLNRFFQERRQPSVKTQMEQCGRRSAFLPGTQEGYSRTSPVHPLPWHLPRKSVLTLLDSGSKSVICLSSPWAVQTSIAIRSMEFTSKKEGDDCNIKVTGVTYKPHPDIKSWPHPSLSSVTSTLLHLLIIAVRVFKEPRDLTWASSRVLWRPTRKTTSRSTPVLDPVVVA